jgi:hypothetical protein
MQKAIAVAASLLASGVAVAQPADVNVRVIVSGDVRPGLYGRVDIGNAPPPPVLYARPMVITPPPPAPGPRPVRAPVQPIYLHVPPGHAKDWRKHCRKYDACGQPVYFVVSDEYKPKKKKKEKKDKD